MTDVIVVGAGAAGLTAAISAARHGASVLILEHMESAGKKLLLTGNGKCNLSNEQIDLTNYRGEEPEFPHYALRAYGLPETREFFLSLGVPFRSRNGYLYPQNEESAGVLTALLAECEKRGVEIKYQIGIQKITRETDGFLFTTKQGAFRSRTCILATGGKSYPRTGSDGSGFLYLGELGHEIKDVVPSLVKLQADAPYLTELAGIRADAHLILVIDHKPVARENGELQLTKDGVSGIPVFQLSRYAAAALGEGKRVELFVNFLPAMAHPAELLNWLKARCRNHPARLSDLLCALTHRKLVPVLLREAAVEDQAAAKVSAEELTRIAALLVGFPFVITGTDALRNAQVTAGGVLTRYVSEKTLESKKTPGLFFCGEMLDVDGPCGGYNLQWAWSSGLLAGKSAAEQCLP